MVDTQVRVLTARLAASSAITLALLCASAARAQDAQSNAQTASEILVTGHGLATTPGAPAYSVRTIERRALISSASGRIEDVLSSVAGFQQFRRSDSRSANPSAQGATLRALGGNASTRALVLLDGVPMTDPFFGYVPFSALVPESLGSVRVTRGGGSGPFGGGALSGTIELTSVGTGDLAPLSASLLASGRGETEASASLAPRLGQGFAVVSGRWDRGKGFWTTPLSQRVPASVRAGYESWSADIRAVAPIAPNIEVQARALVFRDDRTLRFAGADSSSDGQDASLRVVGRGRWQFDALAYVQARDFTNVVVSASTFKRTLDQYATPSTGIGGKLELRPPVGEAHTLRLGVDWRRASGTMKENALNPAGTVTARRRAGGRNDDLGLFVEDDWTLGPLVLTGGLRADRSTIADGWFEARNGAGAVTSRTDYAERSDWTLTWRIGARVKASDAIALRAAAYTGLRLPTLNELYRPFTVFPITTQANAALKNERLRGYEAGLDLTPASGLSLSATVFDNRIEDAIANVTVGPNLRRRQNVPAIRARGVELSGHAEHGPLWLDTSLAWTNAEVVGKGASLALDGKRPAQTPRLAASATLGLVPAPGWRIAATLRHTGAQFEDDLETDMLPAATTVDLYAQVPLVAGAALVLRAENLFDEAVVTRNAGGSMDLGAPRTFWAGLRWGL